MSKIDKLGGYKNAKEAYEFLNSCRWHGAPEPDIDALGAELLAYRRANNIFEDDDSFVYLPEFEPSVQVVKIFKNDLWFGDRSYLAGMIRRATDEEIAAGYRGAK